MARAIVTIRTDKENPVEQKVVREAAKVYGLRTIKMELRHDAGWPDRMVLMPGGRPLFLEFKRPDGSRAELQKRRVAELLDLGYDARFVETFDEAWAAIQERMSLHG